MVPTGGIIIFNTYILEIQPEKQIIRILFVDPQGQALYRAGSGKPVPIRPSAFRRAGVVS
jgi:hypothetical protein